MRSNMLKRMIYLGIKKYIEDHPENNYPTTEFVAQLFANYYSFDEVTIELQNLVNEGSIHQIEHNVWNLVA